MKFIVPVLKWAARILSLVSIGLIVSAFSEKGFETPVTNFQELTLVSCYPFGVVLGMLIAWKAEGIGGMITLLSFVGLYIFTYIFYGFYPSGTEYLKLSSPGAVFILYSLLTYNSRHRNDLF